MSAVQRVSPTSGGSKACGMGRCFVAACCRAADRAARAAKFILSTKLCANRDPSRRRAHPLCPNLFTTAGASSGAAGAHGLGGGGSSSSR